MAYHDTWSFTDILSFLIAPLSRDRSEQLMPLIIFAPRDCQDCYDDEDNDFDI
jgi:hypothetical protein